MGKERTRVSLDIVTTRHHHGSKGVKLRNIKSGVSSKFQAILKNKIDPVVLSNTNNENTSGESPEGENQSSTKKEEKDMFAYSPKEYDTHNGNTQVDRFFDQEFSSLDEAISKCNAVVSNSSAKMEQMTSIDIKALKKQYSDFKQAVLQKFQRTHGSSISEENLPEVQRELASKSFDYCQHQIRVTITSTEPFVGAKSYQKADGSFVYQISYLSKSYYTLGKSLLPKELRLAFRSLSQDTVIQFKTTKARCACHIVTNDRGMYIIVFDNDSKFYPSSAQEEDHDPY